MIIILNGVYSEGLLFRSFFFIRKGHYFDDFYPKGLFYIVLNFGVMTRDLARNLKLPVFLNSSARPKLS